MAERRHLERFETDKPHLMPKVTKSPCAEAAASANMTEQAFKSGIRCFRERIRIFFLQAVSDTVSDPEGGNRGPMN